MANTGNRSQLCLKVFDSVQSTRSLTKYMYGQKSNLVPRVSPLPASRGQEEERPWERGCQKSWLLYKANRFHFAVGLYSDKAQRTSKHGKNISHATRLRLVSVLLCFYQVLTSSVRYQRTDARQNEIYLLNTKYR